ncbi:MAG: sugar kinase [Anaerolineales bacterium]|nr:sugar kinase [Anaerolineales bacterium]
MSRYEVTGIGEIMLRYSVPAGTRLETAARLDVFAGGAEANTISALAYLGHRTGYATAVPDSPIGRLVVQPLRAAGVDLAPVYWSSEDRLGIYYLEFSEAPRPIQVIYDRKDSAAANMTAAQINWDLLLDTQILHITGITPAISPGALALTREIFARAKEHGCRISFDINYRSKLWSPAEANAALRPLLSSVDHFFCGIGDARGVLGCTGTPPEILEQLLALSGASTAVLTLGEDGLIGSEGGDVIEVAARPVHTIDRLGAGDAMAAGVLHGLLGGDFKQGLHYGVMMAALALTQHGDIVITSAAELEMLMAAAGSSISR